MGFVECFNNYPAILMEGAIGERLKREYNISFDEQIAMAGLIYTADGRFALNQLFREYLAIAEQYQLPFLCTTPTRRANRERVSSSAFGSKVIEDNVRFLQEIKSGAGISMFVGGLMGCKGDPYLGTEVLSIAQAEEFHAWQAAQFKCAGADFLYAGIMPALPEAIGMAKAMANTGIPYIISFMIRDNGKLIDGTAINEAIFAIDKATEPKPLCYMVNCVHPLILRKALAWPVNRTKLVQERFRGIQANASPLSPEELDNCCNLRSSDSKELAQSMLELKKSYSLKIFGGCCGTDNTHMAEIAKIISEVQA